MMNKNVNSRKFGLEVKKLKYLTDELLCNSNSNITEREIQDISALNDRIKNILYPYKNMGETSRINTNTMSFKKELQGHKDYLRAKQALQSGDITLFKSLVMNMMDDLKK